MKIEDFLAQEKFSSYIRGTFVSYPKKKGTDYDSPVEGKKWKTIVFAENEDVDRSIECAKEAFFSWKKTPAPIRGSYLRKMADLMMVYQKELALLMTQEMGKPISESEAEVEYASGYFSWFAGEAERIYGITIPSQYENKRLKIIYEPVGPCGVITPWNFPLAIPARKIAPALASGCTVVCKPSPETPLTSLAMAALGDEVGLPPGVLNVVIGGEKEIGKKLLESGDIRKISFTGSSDIGKYLYHHSASTLKKLTLELGGLAPAIVYDRAIPEKAVKEIIAAKFRNTGQTCIAPNRIFVHDPIYDEFLEHYKNSVKNLKIGDPRKGATELSQILHPKSIKKIKAHINDADQHGATFELQGKEPYEPTIISGVTDQMLVYHEETFGPISPIIRFKTIEDAIELANDTPYGLAAYLFTEDITQADATVSGLRFGIISVNDGTPSTPQASFGGMKYSGFGREGGPTGIYEYMVEKYVSLKI